MRCRSGIASASPATASAVTPAASRGRGAPRAQPQHEREEEQRREREQIALGHAEDVPRCEHSDLDHEPQRVRHRDGEERGLWRREIAAARRAGDEQDERGRRRDGGEERRGARVMRRPDERVAERVRRLARGRVHAQELRPRSGVAGLPQRPRERGCAERGAGRREPPQRDSPAQHAVDAEGGHERRHERDGLHARRGGGHERRDEQHLPRPRRRDEHARDRPARDDGERVVGDLAHDQPGVGESRDRDGQRRGCERPPLRHQLASPQEHGNRGGGHHDGLERLQERVPMLEVVERERQADERRVHEADERRRPRQDLELAALVQPAAEQAVHHLVGRDPGPRQRERGEEPEQARDEHERDQADPRRHDGEPRHGAPS